MCFISLIISDCSQSQPNNNNSNNVPSKTDYLGYWHDLYSQRAELKMSDIGDFIEAEIKWASSAVENTKWIFECQYELNTGNLMCKNGEQIEIYPVKNGKRVYGAGDNPDDIEENIVKQNLQATISVKKGNLRKALDQVDYFGDKNEAMNTYKNMTLKINFTDLSQCIFAK